MPSVLYAVFGVRFRKEFGMSCCSSACRFPWDSFGGLVSPIVTVRT